MKSLIKIPLIALFAGVLFLSGCASKKELAEVRAIAEQALAESQAANAKADDAVASAEDANIKIDNMFKKAMQK